MAEPEAKAEAKVEAKVETKVEAKVEPPKARKVQQGPSRRCRHWARGMCKLGQDCSFLHTGVAGVHVPCRHFVRTGSCSRGNLCDFKHDTSLAYGFYAARVSQIRGEAPAPPPAAAPGYYPPPPFLPTPLALPLPPVTFHTQADPSTPNASYRPAPCRHWKKGLCRLGRACGFSHDSAVPQKFRTTACRHWLKGACRLGEACSFAHPPKPSPPEPPEPPE